MIIQSVIYPNEICPYKELYYQCEKELEQRQGHLVLPADNKVSFFSYMNMFDANAWEKYTTIQTVMFVVDLYGSGHISLKCKTGEQDIVLKEQDFGVEAQQQKESFSDIIHLKEQKGIYFFEVTASSDVLIENARFETDISEMKCETVEIAINICTYHRNEDVIRNVRQLKQSRFFDSYDELFQKLCVIIVDNGSELSIIDEPNIKLVHNPNTGGSGGFRRGLQEIRSWKRNITHVVFMDDDVEFLLESMYRLYSLLSYIRKEYVYESVAGRMFRLDKRWIQYTAAEIWNKGDLRHIGLNEDMMQKEAILCSNINDNAEYGGWWFCCYPIEFVRENDPLPFFIHCDDVEYGLRHGGTPIILNGIQVWHETYEYRQSPVIAYYDTRNPLIVNTMYGLIPDHTKVLMEWKSKITKQHVNKKFLTEQMIILGMWDYLKGIKWLYKIKSDRYNIFLCKMNGNRVINAFLWCYTKKKYNKKFLLNKEKKMSEPKVSVVVPVCNVENYLKECIDSILCQTLKDIEIICVDDGSKDNSLAILKKYEEKDERVVVITKSNSGYGNTMNVGMDRACGKYIGIVESDDFIEPNMFERLYETAEKYNADIVKSDHYIFNTADKVHQPQYICPDEYYNKVLNVDVYEGIYDFVMMNWTGIYSRDFLYKHNVRHNETPGASFQDNGFWFQVITLAKKIVFIHEAFYHYRQDNPNSSINSKEKVYCICDEYKYIQEFLINNEELCKKYFTKLFVKKVFNYLHSYKRISDKYKIEFLEYIAEEFKVDLKRSYLQVDRLDPWILDTVNRIIDSPKMYYLIDEQYVLREEYDRIHDLLIQLRNSNEFKTGLKIKRLLRV